MSPRALALLLLGLASPAGGEEPGPIIPIAVAVAADEGRAVVDEAWIDGQIAEANRLYAVIPLRFRRASLTAGSHPAHVVTRADRDACVTALAPGAINLRVVGSLLDVDEPGRVRRGVHWRLRGGPRRHAVILSAIAAPTILAHELGHFFGNPHSPTADNLMSYTRTGGPLFLDPAQLTRTRRALRRYLAAGALVDSSPDRK